MSELTILVNSCDSYSDLWEPFFTLLKRHWPNINENSIMLNSESKSFSIPEMNIVQPMLSDDDCTTWSKRFKACLNQIKTKYVLIMLDDFWIEKDVDVARLNACVEAMEKDEAIKNFSFVPTLWQNKNDGVFEYFELRKKGPYMLNLQAGLWRTEELKKLVVENENPWQFETLGTYRAAKAGGKYYVAKEGCPQVFEYNWKAGGAVHRGKWTDGVEEILRDIGVEMDFTIRGWDRETLAEHSQEGHKTLRKRISDLVWPFVEWYRYFR